MQLAIFQSKLKNGLLHFEHVISGPDRLEFEKFGIKSICNKVIRGREDIYRFG